MNNIRKYDEKFKKKLKYTNYVKDNNLHLDVKACQKAINFRETIVVSFCQTVLDLQTVVVGGRNHNLLSTDD